MSADRRALPRAAGAPSWHALLLVTALLWQVLVVSFVDAKSDGPTIKVNTFDWEPVNLNYFQDSDVVLFQDRAAGIIYRSSDGGATWAVVDAIPGGKAIVLIMHEYDPTRAYVLTGGAHHWRTHDRGKTWETFFTDAGLDLLHADWLVFHATNPDHIMFYGADCEGNFCGPVVMYTTDGFRSDAKFLRGMAENCWWAKSSPMFSTGDTENDENRILCIVPSHFSFESNNNNRLLISDNFFSAEDKSGVIQEFEPNLNGYGSVTGAVNLAVVKKYMLVATVSKNTDEMALYVTDDTKSWHRAVFPSDHGIKQTAYTVLEGTNYSIQIDVMYARPSNPMGIMLTSNSNGTYFTRNAEHTNRNQMGRVDFEKISGIQGIFLVNQVANWEDVEKNEKVKKIIKTNITFDDGRTFEGVKSADEDVHLHSVTELDNVGRVFSSPAPGLVMGNGNTGKSLDKYDNANLYVSDDAGRTWIKGLDGPHKYEFGDQGSILLAIHDSKSPNVGELRYSLNHGKTWLTVELPDRLKIQPRILTTTQDSTSLKFLLTGQSDEHKYHIISIDFDGLHENTCKESDMEDWFARVDKDNKPSCLMGHTQKYHRRKKDAECFIKHEFKDPVPVNEPCECSDADFECDFNFVRKDGKCEKAGPVVLPDGACKSGKPDDTFMGSSGWRLIPGNDCKRKGGDQKDAPKEWKCSDAAATPGAGGGEADGKITQVQTPIEGGFNAIDKHYLERGENNEAGETVIMRPYDQTTLKAGAIQISQDHGKTWTAPERLADEKIWKIVSHQYVKNIVFFITAEERVIYSVDSGQHFYSFKPPYAIDQARGGSPLAFHPDRKDWLIWHGSRCDKSQCHPEASISTDRGDSWKTLARFTRRCEFTGSAAYKRFGRPENQVICLKRAREDNEDDNPLELAYIEDFTDERKDDLKIVHTYVKDFATMAEFIVVATENRTAATLSAWASIDGMKYAQAHFPYKFEVPHQRLYTVLDSSTHAVNLFVATTEEQLNRPFGSILRSNSNGTSYVLSISGVNCDTAGYVDFEKMLGIQGVILVNTVQNIEDKSEPKKLQTRISHNDGAEWAFLPPPKKDLDGNSYPGCSGEGTEKCALHIHGYTERYDRGKTYSSENAVGIMFGWGNVGPTLGDAKDADTFMTTDAGISWKVAKKGRWTWSFGDRGSIIVLAQRETRTKTISYTTDEGATWKDHPLGLDSDMVITDITTLRSGSSRNFLIWGHQGDKLLTINLDFSGLTNQICKFDKDDLSKSDYTLWSPRHPKQPDGCLFGHKAEYLRKKIDRNCFNAQQMQHLWGFDNCTCTRQDFECDYNYEMDGHGQCKLVSGFQPLSLEEYCKENPGAIEFYEPSGYRRIPLTTCSGGDEYDKTKAVHPCPGKEEEFEKAHSTSGVIIFFAIIIPIAVASAVGWWVWRNWSGKFGQIRLGDHGSSFDSDSPLVKYPVIVISGVVAVIGALPLLASSLWRSATSFFERVTGRGGPSYSWLGGNAPRRFTTRDSFARGRADYAIVDEDEGELLGEDSDEEV